MNGIDLRYPRVRLIIWDFIGADKNWVLSQLQSEKVDIIAFLDPAVSAEDAAGCLNDPDTYDHLLVVDRALVRIPVKNVLETLLVPEEKILFLQDYENLLRQWKISLYIFCDEMIRNIEYHQLKENEKYCLASFDDMIYMGNASDKVIMPYCFMMKRNWAVDDMLNFYSLAQKYYDIDPAKPGYFCDIGANIGTTCVYFKRHIDTSVRILAVEPQTDNYKCLKMNCILNDIPDDEVILFRGGVSDRTAELTVDFDKDNPGSSFLSESGDGERIKTYKFDDILAQCQIPADMIKYIWVDVEGFEGFFLKGAEKTLREINVPIVMEYSHDLLTERGSEELYFEMVTKLFGSYIIMGDKDKKVRPISMIDELKHGEYADMLQDIFYIK